MPCAMGDRGARRPAIVIAWPLLPPTLSIAGASAWMPAAAVVAAAAAALMVPPGGVRNDYRWTHELGAERRGSRV